MGKKKAYIKFEAEYSQEVKELLVLTSESVGGACSAGDGLWEARAEFLASVDPESGELSEQQGSLSWLCEDKDRGDWVYDLK
ncbi:MAG: hypothetical protein K2N94_09940, partial [Lachnospiraceae bacterium]|nr:hypothetical protein [Lachnospiraceae bacterium]